MPFAGYADFDACVIDQTGKGYSADVARKICGKLQSEAEGKKDALAFDGVERAEANGPPTAFRIWKAGANPTDHGPTIFSEKSAALLMAEQATRGNRYSIDVDHMSLDKSAPIENHAAVGWFSLEVRDGELWATDVEWTNDTIRDGLTRGAWKYTSSAYDVNDDGEVVSFLNLAITNNPATWGVTALANRKIRASRNVLAACEARKSHMADTEKMAWGALKAALDGDDEDKKAAAYAQIAAAFPEHSEPDGDEGEKKDAEDKPEKKDAADDADKKDDAADGDEKKDAAASVSASIVAAQDARIRKLEADNARFVKEREAKERADLLASRDVSADLAKALADKPLDTVRSICAALPRKARPVVSTEHVQATRGGNAQDARGPRLPPEEHKSLKERMGLSSRTDSIRWEGAARVFPVGATTPATLAAKESK